MIYSTFVQTFSDSARIEVTIKVNQENVFSILATLERFEYQVKATFNEAKDFDTLRDRYDSLIAFLNV